MLTKKMESALIGQITKEMYSAYLYMSMSNHAQTIGLKGFANWFMVQYHEEMLHSMKFYEYIQKQGGSVTLKAMDEPPHVFKSPTDMFEQTLTHEHFITKSINELMDVAIGEKDHATQIFLQWYVSEQVEEEQNDNDILNSLKLIGADAHGLFMLDKDLAARIVSIPTDFSKGVEAALAAKGAP